MTDYPCISPSGTCAYPDCEAEATTVVAVRIGDGSVAAFCGPHAEQVVDRDYPEYTAVCPNCGCLQGVN